MCSVLSSRVALPADLPEALRVWQSANIARGLAPASVRISRVQEKLTDPAATWSTASLWTRAGNERARRLYERHGYQLTGDTNLLAAGDQILRYEAHLQ
jgi:hypothetical protein